MLKCHSENDVEMQCGSVICNAALKCNRECNWESTEDPLADCKAFEIKRVTASGNERPPGSNSQLGLRSRSDQTTYEIKRPFAIKQPRRSNKKAVSEPPTNQHQHYTKYSNPYCRVDLIGRLPKNTPGSVTQFPWHGGGTLPTIYLRCPPLVHWVRRCNVWMCMRGMV